ncbi:MULTISPECIES: hypothetical protein [Methanothrix]|jgi:hypothetical protein|nr:hypothetical protein [Methanothrix soehngenii]
MRQYTVVYGNRTTEAQRHRGRTNGDDYPGGNWVGFLRLDGKEG